jgi:hypothetical protein
VDPLGEHLEAQLIEQILLGLTTQEATQRLLVLNWPRLADSQRSRTSASITSMPRSAASCSSASRMSKVESAWDSSCLRA